MAVYVDATFQMVSREAQARRVGSRNGHNWCHMWADTEEELHKMANQIGMKRAWFQDKQDFPHYDLVPSRRAHAVHLGAIETDVKAALAFRVANRQKRIASNQCSPS